MPKITKEVSKENSKISNSKSSSNLKKTSSKTVAQKKESTSSISTKSVNKKSASTVKKTKNNVSKKNSSNRKSPSKKQTTTSKKKISKIDVLEYYDLPYRYNETTVKILAQTPKTLFVYWDISDNDRQRYINQYGDDFFKKTKPILIIHNITMNYTFEIEINDFANCWYFNINDEKCEYSVELGRRTKDFSENNMQIANNYLYITSSNKIESPNGHILFEKDQSIVFYKDVKTNKTFSKNISNLEFIKYLGKTYTTYDMYKKIYKEDEFLQKPNNPTSY